MRTTADSPLECILFGGTAVVEVWLPVFCLVGLRESEEVEVWLPVFCLVGLRE
jgi:hypothetical protein